MKRVLVVCTTHRDKRELVKKKISDRYHIIFQEYDDSILEKIICGCEDDFSKIISAAQLLNAVRLLVRKGIDGILSTDDYPGSIVANIIAQEMNLSGADPQIILQCQHKYLSRCAQKKYVPEATPHFQLFDYKKNISNLSVPLPCFVKPVKSFFSIMAHSIYSVEELERKITHSIPPDIFLEQFHWFLDNYTNFTMHARYLLVEELLSGYQVTLEGFVHHGKIGIMGIVDSIMFPGTICFERFEYPSSLPDQVQAQMVEIAHRFVKGIGLDNTMFNIEMMYNPLINSIHIIEINPRMSSQFSDLYEKVDGVNSYEIALAVCTGAQPPIEKNNGIYAYAASFVLRVFEDYFVNDIPKKTDFEEVYKRFPDVRIEIFVIPGQKLSDILQDGKSYRYGLIQLGAANQQELFENFEECKRLLPFQFKQY